jgi:phytoene dehydrogenase-like protein
LLGEKHNTSKLINYIKPLSDETNWAFHVFLGVNRDLSKEPSSLHVMLNKPVEIAGHTCNHLEMQMYGFDKSMAPEGKGMIKVELFSTWDYCKKLGENKQAYEAEKTAIAQKVIEILDSTYFKGLKDQIEVVDVPTLLTWARYLNSQNGFLGYPNRKMDMLASFLGKSDTETLKNVKNFRFVGTWATATGALFANVFSGKKAIKEICKAEKLKFNAVK